MFQIQDQIYFHFFIKAVPFTNPKVVSNFTNAIITSAIQRTAS